MKYKAVRDFAIGTVSAKKGQVLDESFFGQLESGRRLDLLKSGNLMIEDKDDAAQDMLVPKSQDGGAPGEKTKEEFDKENEESAKAQAKAPQGGAQGLRPAGPGQGMVPQNTVAKESHAGVAPAQTQVAKK